ncbi:MAG: hypothetical protein PVJ28_00275 [Acidimicrobiia bacterium]|jgi:hypothetical protein
MLRDFINQSAGFHDEYVRRHANPPEPLEQPRHGLRRALGMTLIHLGERLTRTEHTPGQKAA